MATTIVDWINDGTLPQTKASGSWTPSQFNTGKFRQTWSPTNASTHSTWRPASTTYWALTSTNDANGGGLWLEWDPGTSTHTLMVVSAATGLPISGGTRAITWGAAPSITYTVDQSSATAGASTLTVAGASTGNGTSSGYTRENILTGANLYLGVWGSGGFGLVASTFGDVDDGNDSTAGTGTPAVGAVTSSGAGTHPIAATGTPSVPAVTGSGAGAVALSGTGSPAMPSVTSAGAGTLALAGSGAPAVPDVTGSGSGSIGGGGVGGTGSPDIGAVASTGAGALALAGSGAATVPAVGPAGAGTVAIAGAGSPAMPAPSSAGAGALTIAGIGSPSVAPVTSTGSGSETAIVSWGSYDAQRVLYGTAAGTVTTESLTTINGSTFVVVTGGNLGDIATAPTDSKGNTYTRLGTAMEFSRWTGYGLVAWVCVDGVGGSGHTFSQQFGQTLGFDEMTIAAAEVRNGHHVQGYTYAQALTGAALTFGAITTTAAAILPAYFCGDAPTGATTTVSLSNGYTIDDTDTLPDHPSGYVPIAIGHGDKPTVGSHGTTATESPDQGAIMIQVALQAAAVTAGTGAPTVAPITSTGSGALTHAGQGAIAVAPIVSSGAGTVAIAGGASATVGSPAATGSGHVALAGSGSPSVQPITGAGGGALPIAGSGGGSAGAVTAVGAGGLPVAGGGLPSVPNVGGAGSGAVAIAGTGSPDAGVVTSSGAGTGATGPLGTGAPAVESVTATGSGVLPIVGAGSVGAGAVEVAGSGSLPIAGAGSVAVAAITSSSSPIATAVLLPSADLLTWEDLDDDFPEIEDI